MVKIRDENSAAYQSHEVERSLGLVSRRKRNQQHFHQNCRSRPQVWPFLKFVSHVREVILIPESTMNIHLGWLTIRQSCAGKDMTYFEYVY